MAIRQMLLILASVMTLLVSDAWVDESPVILTELLLLGFVNSIVFLLHGWLDKQGQ